MGKSSLAEIKDKNSADIYTTEELFMMQNSCVITITSEAAQILADQTSSDVYIGLSTKGCNGLSYFVEKPTVKNTSSAIKFQIKDIIVWADKEVISTIENNVGTLDYVSDKFKKDFVFTTGKETSRCGCGESFSI